MPLLRDSPLLVLFLVAATGYLVGKIELAGFSLGVAAVLFAGLALGAVDPRLALPEIVQAFGLVVFVYGIGISSGPGFFASFRRRGLRDNAATLGLLCGGAALTAALTRALGLSGATAAGTFAGALTNTPALASVLESTKLAPDMATRDAPAIAYAVTYPMGVIGVGAIPVPMPGGSTFRLGIAGGPLVVGLLLGRAGRTWRLVWTLPYSANLTLRQIGLVLFLAGVGTRSGNAFVTTLQHGGFAIFAAGAVVTFTVATTMLIVGRKVLGIPMAMLAGMVAGAHTQMKSDQTNVGYASVYPLATIAKIVLAQVLLAVLR